MRNGHDEVAEGSNPRAFRPVVDSRAHEYVVDQIAFGIRSGVYRVGERLPSVEGMAEQFMTSPEYQALYGGLFNTDFVQTTYRNTLDRQGEPSGVTYWTKQLDAGLPRSVMVTSFSESQEHVSLTATDILGTTPGQLGIRLA